MLKHLLLHCIEMARFILREKSDRANGKFFAAGKDAADALVLAVGPVKRYGYAHAEAAPIGDKEVADFAAGVLYGLTGDNQSAQFETCFKGTDNFYTLAQHLILDLQAADIEQA